MKLDARRLFTCLLGLPVVVGLVGLFIGLGHSSFWYDELFTAWVVKSDRNPAHVFSRILTDLHPPVYYFSTYLYSLVFGTGDGALRSYSALAVLGAALLILFATRRVLSLNARLVACGLMLGSKYAFYMSQNARSYALCMLIGAGMLALAIAITGDERRRWVKIAGLFALGVLGAFTHYFMTFEAVALCGVLALYLPTKPRIALVVFAILLVGANALYVRAVVNVFAQFSPTHTWMDNDFDTYVSDIGDTLSFLGYKAVAVFGVCALVFVLDLYAERLRPVEVSGTISNRYWLGSKSLVKWFQGFDPMDAICLFVPLLVIAFSIGSSFLRPNFNPQNLLIVGPFIWCGCARLYDHAMGRTQPYLKWSADIAIAVLILGMAGVVAGRFVERNEPWKESAQAVQTYAACRGQVIPVVSEDGPYLRNPKFPDQYAPYLYGYYLNGFAPTRIFELTDIKQGKIPDDIRAIIAERLKGGGCPIVAWSAHTPPDHFADILIPELTKTVGKVAPGYHLEKDEYDFYDQVLGNDPATNPGFIVTVAPGPKPAKTDDDDN
jgi:4-amino-4-deoxy-L-arabinose transferase-like glycosyltransferase